MWIVIIIGFSLYFNQTTALGKSKRIQNMQGRIQEFQNGGAVEFLDLVIVLMPLDKNHTFS